ncbi:MAG: hypothetical protein JXR53_12935 [Bacteroidales bacterium]|nr:hypothetical protein [Bacteroidales bacterium]
MKFKPEHIYHIYNQGNNRQRIFFKAENYVFFMKKIERHVLPYADILAWCLMPNHFYLMVRVREVEIPKERVDEGFSQCGIHLTHPMTQSHRMSKTKQQTLNSSIAIMLRSYTRAINKQEGFSGSLFRSKTKAEFVNCSKVTPSFSSGEISNREEQYLLTCFNYIHQNLVKAGLVYHEADWEFFSAFDFAGYRSNSFVNKNLAEDLGLILAYSSDDTK